MLRNTANIWAQNTMSITHMTVTTMMYMVYAVHLTEKNPNDSQPVDMKNNDICGRILSF